jgi:hypothetical protein
MPSVESSPLLRRIRAALDSLELDNGRLVISVADEPKWERSASGDEVLVRWLCWSIENDGQEVVAPEFEVVGTDVTRERLAIELPDLFRDVQVTVDNEIEA